MRASSLQELVYKGGQAGVTKATVTITFDNSDKKQSPLGYETFDEITVSRQVSKTYCSLLEFFLFSFFCKLWNTHSVRSSRKIRTSRQMY